VLEGLLVARSVVVAKGALEGAVAYALAAVANLLAVEVLLEHTVEGFGEDLGLAVGVHAGGGSTGGVVKNASGVSGGVGGGGGGGVGGGGLTAAVAQLCSYNLVHVMFVVHAVSKACTPASIVVVVHVPGETVVVGLAGRVAAPETESIGGGKADLVVSGETEGPVDYTVPVRAVDAVSTAKGTVARVSAVVATREHTLGGGESTEVVVVATVVHVLGGDEHPVVVGVPVANDVAHVTTVLGTVSFVKAKRPARNESLRDVVVDADLGFLRGVCYVLGFTIAEGFVVLLVAIVERAVGVEALVDREAGVVTGSAVGHVLHVGGFGYFGSHLFGGHEGEEEGGNLHC